MIIIIDDDEIMAECIASSCYALDEVKIFTNAIEAMQAIDDGVMPSIIFLDILLDGPDGFTLLNELSSYSDTSAIPVVVVSSLDLSKYNLSTYGVVGILDKSTMTPSDILSFVKRFHAHIAKSPSNHLQPHPQNNGAPK